MQDHQSDASTTDRVQSTGGSSTDLVDDGPVGDELHRQTERRLDGSTVDVEFLAADNPDPIEDAPAVCGECSQLGAVPHRCESPDECPCGSPMCGAPFIDEAAPDVGD